MDTSGVLNFLLQIESGWTYLIAFIGCMPRSGLPGLKKHILLRILKLTDKLPSKMVLPIYISTSWVQQYLFPCVLTKAVSRFFNLTYLNKVWSFTNLMITSWICIPTRNRNYQRALMLKAQKSMILIIKLHYIIMSQAISSVLLVR